MSIAHVVGVDPGLVDTGVMSLGFIPSRKVLEVASHLVQGPDAAATANWIKRLSNRPEVYVEQYRPRQRLNTDVRMVQAEQRFRLELPKATFLNNMGIKRVVSDTLLQTLEVWTFKQTSHHQDLRSAARIALLGMLKDDRLNAVVADVVRAHLDGSPWNVRHA